MCLPLGEDEAVPLPLRGSKRRIWKSVGRPRRIGASSNCDFQISTGWPERFSALSSDHSNWRDPELIDTLGKIGESFPGQESPVIVSKMWHERCLVPLERIH